jgi:hypothetical protein
VAHRAERVGELLQCAVQLVRTRQFLPWDSAVAASAMTCRQFLYRDRRLGAQQADQANGSPPSARRGGFRLITLSVLDIQCQTRLACWDRDTHSGGLLS